VTLLGVTDQSTLGGLLGSQSVATFRAVGPTTNGKTVLQNCKVSVCWQGRVWWLTGCGV
jgi:hypothetical protein